jgi:hypothetical protein
MIMKMKTLYTKPLIVVIEAPELCSSLAQFSKGEVKNADKQDQTKTNGLNIGGADDTDEGAKKYNMNSWDYEW